MSAVSPIRRFWETNGQWPPLPLHLAYLRLIEPRASGAGQAEADHQNVPFSSELFRPLWPNALIAAGNYMLAPV